MANTGHRFIIHIERTFFDHHQALHWEGSGIRWACLQRTVRQTRTTKMDIKEGRFQVYIKPNPPQ